MRTIPRDAIQPSSGRIVVGVAPSFSREHTANRIARKPPASRHCAASAPTAQSIAEHGPYRADGHEQAVRPVFEALESEAAAEFHAAREGLVPAVIDHIEHDQPDPRFARDIPDAAERIDCEIRPESLALPAPVDGFHREVQGRNGAGVGRPPGLVCTEALGRDRMGIQRVVAEDLR
ncbi:MAG: hypothetical protein F4051_03285 [Boseongicola sp. SB0670_bin_30]|nr:hypothetical protein [Boseongicola sp. SB0670_bin_30]